MAFRPLLILIRGFRKNLFQLSNQSCSQNFMLQRLRPNIRAATPSINDDLLWKNGNWFWKMIFRPLLTLIRGFKKYLFQLSNQSRSQNFMLQRLRPNIEVVPPSINNDLLWKNENWFWKMAFRPLLTSIRGFRKYLFQLSNQSSSQNLMLQRLRPNIRAP